METKLNMLDRLMKECPELSFEKAYKIVFTYEPTPIYVLELIKDSGLETAMLPQLCEWIHRELSKNKLK